jgi:hypothetical protein
MKISLFFIVTFSLFYSYTFGQEVETIKIKKQKNLLFKGADQKIQDWYLFYDNDSTFYMANLKIDISEVENWFEKRKNSQNIYKGRMNYGRYETMTLAKENEPMNDLRFYVKRDKIGVIELISMDDGFIYIFQKM